MFIFDTAVSFLFYGSWGFNSVALIRVSFWILPLVNVLLFLETFQEKLSYAFKRSVWTIILSLLVIFNTIFICWLWLIYFPLYPETGFETSYRSMTVIGTAPPTLALVITEFIAGFFYLVNEKPQGLSKTILIKSLAFVIFVNIAFGILGFLI